MKAEQLARGLGWFSLAVGALEVALPGRLTRFLGVPERSGLVRAYGLRELAAGAALLTQPTGAVWVWARVACDVLDLATLGAAPTQDPAGRKRAGNTLALLTAVTVVDVLCARALTMKPPTPPSLMGRLLGRKGKR